MGKKLFWKAAPAPTGPYRSFYHRGWPTAYTDRKEEFVIAGISCDDNYNPRVLKEALHKELSVRVAVKNDRRSFDWKRLKARFKTLEEAKAGAQAFYDAHPELFPKEK